MIKEIKIYGERHSGTTFLLRLIRNNISNNIAGHFKLEKDKIKFCSNKLKSNKGTGWKHGVPNLDLYKNLDSTLFIFIIRDLENWLKAMFKEPIHLNKSDNIESFLTSNLVACRKKIKSLELDVYSNKEETNKTIFELRYYKLNSYFDTFKNVKNAIFINLEGIQQDKGEKFINVISEKFKLKKSVVFHPIEKHTKIFTGDESQNKQNREKDINIDSSILDKGKNLELEKFVESLKENFHIKSSV